jgi:hypothetical protein
MKKSVVNPVAPVVEIATEQEKAVHPLLKSYTFVSTKHVDYDKLTAFEAVSMAAVFLLTITAGVVLATA